MKTLREIASRAYRTGIDDITGYRSSDPALKSVTTFTLEDVAQELTEAKRNAINRFTGAVDKIAMRKSFDEIVKKYAYQAGILKGRKEKSPAASAIAARAKSILGS